MVSESVCVLVDVHRVFFPFKLIDGTISTAKTNHLGYNMRPHVEKFLTQTYNPHLLSGPDLFSLSCLLRVR